MKKKFDVIIIGGGASGLACAVRAKQKNNKLNIAIIEKNDRVGKKLLSTGNGRCNLTNKSIDSSKYIGSFQPKLTGVLAEYPTKRVIDFFNDLGLLVYADSEGRYYPMCRQASAVLDVLRFACEKSGVKVFCAENIKSLRKNGNAYLITTQNGEFLGEKLVIACGSKAAPKLGGTSCATDYLKNLGHKVTPFAPALCPIKVKSSVIKSLKGLRAVGTAKLYKDKKSVKSEHGEIQFAEDSLSGICVFNLSLYAERDDIISLDLLPNYSELELFERLKRNKKLFSFLSLDNIMTGIFQKRIAQAILKQSGLSNLSDLCGNIDDIDLKKICFTAKHIQFTVIENCGFDRAQCAKGGVVGHQIDEKTMKSKRQKNLYICGEAIDICGECGGYNLHFAFASGMIAGESL